ncbi:uncharacterized protein LOC135949173 [Calliphora vicina]|uniref:uncharacterized protein LOC135949173 n=1 Tax=Calliphora vicina TaxID=7373 RepID=UPI00325C3412
MFDYPCTYDDQQKLWRSVERQEMFNENISAGQAALFMMRNKNPQDVMQVSDSEGTTLTYGTALTAAIRIAQHFEKLQLTSDDVVSIFSTNTTYVMPVALACWFNATPFQPMNPVMETHVAVQIFDNIKPKIIFCDGLHYEMVKKASKAFNPAIYTLCNHLENVAQIEDLLKPTKTEQYYKAQPLTKGPNQTMAIILSSGTTGLPKGICLSNRYVTTDFTLSHQYETVFSASSLDWLTGLMTFMINVLVGGLRVIIHKPCTAEYLQELIVKYKITYMASNPSVLSQLSLLPSSTKESMASVRTVVMGGTQCSANTLKRIRSCLTNACMYFGYGNTEAGIISWNWRDYKLNSVGKMLPNTQLKIIDQNTGERLAPNQLGEVCAMKNNQPWLGYYKNPVTTQKTVDAEGFTHTGDMGYMDEEHYLHLIDRCRDVMKYRGFKYAPHEIEMIVSEIPDVIDVCVFGVYDPKDGHVPAAAVVKKSGSCYSEIDVVKYVESRCEVFYKHLDRGVFFLNELSRNRNGKLMRDTIMEICLSREEEDRDHVDR